MELLPISFIAGVLTILAPCVLPLLPIIIGGSLTEKSIKRPIIITVSLALSIVLFTLILKVSTAFITIPESFWKNFSATIVIFFAITLLFPNLYAKIVNKLFSGKIEHKFQKIAFNQSKKSTVTSSIFLGAALGPIFAACSPTYFLILGTVLPASFGIGLLNLFAYAIGLALVMFLVAFAGQKVMTKLNVAANPNGWFKKGLGILFLIVGIGIFTGYDKVLETAILEAGYFDITAVEQKILEQSGNL